MCFSSFTRKRNLTHSHSDTLPSPLKIHRRLNSPDCLALLNSFTPKVVVAIAIVVVVIVATVVVTVVGAYVAVTVVVLPLL